MQRELRLPFLIQLMSRYFSNGTEITAYIKPLGGRHVIQSFKILFKFLAKADGSFDALKAKWNLL